MNGRLLTCIFTSSLLCGNVHAHPHTIKSDKALLPNKQLTVIKKSNEEHKQKLTRKSQSNQALQEFITLVTKNKFTLAYQKGSSIYNQWEGDEAFDFNFALAAAQTGHYNQAIFPFERLLDNKPNNNRYRLELARCHFFLNNLHAAEREFTLVSETNPPAQVQTHINNFLARIEEQKQQLSQSWNVGAGIALGYDSNINAAANLDTIEATFYTDGNPVLRGALILDNEQKSQESSYYQIHSYGQYLLPISKRSIIDITINAAMKDNHINDTYDLVNLALKGGLKFLRNTYSIRLGSSLRQYWLASEKLQNQISTDINWQWHFYPHWKTNTELEIGYQDNDQNDALDFQQWQTKISINRDIKGFNQNIQLGLGADIAERNENSFQGRSYYSLGYQVQQKLTPAQKIYALINYTNTVYADSFDDEHIFFANKTKRSQLIQGIIGWVLNFSPDISLKTQLSHSQNISNLELYDYQRTLIETGLAISFK